MNALIDLPSPAKINLFLRILERRDDGYHNLQTAFQFIDLHDRMSFHSRSDGIIRLTTSIETVAEQDNLIIRAAKLLQASSHSSMGADIAIDKRIPMGAGLGGGSSNAATTLLALNQLWQLKLSQQKLLSLATTLGADVPIFIHGHAAWAEGIGERLTTISPEQPWYLLIHPAVHVSTAQLFQALCRDTKYQQRVTETCDPLCLGNDFEAVLYSLYPEIQSIVETMKPHAPLHLTGSGSVVYARFDSAKEASTIASLAPANCHTFVAKGLNISPLHHALAEQIVES